MQGSSYAVLKINSRSHDQHGSIFLSNYIETRIKRTFQVHPLGHEICLDRLANWSSLIVLVEVTNIAFGIDLLESVL